MMAAKWTSAGHCFLISSICTAIVKLPNLFTGLKIMKKASMDILNKESIMRFSFEKKYLLSFLHNRYLSQECRNMQAYNSTTLLRK